MRSSTPPWPGISVPLSFMSAARFNIDSNRSPMMPATTMPMPTLPYHHHGYAGSQYEPASARKIGATTKPPNAPSRVFFGLRAGASGVRPSVRPV